VLRPRCRPRALTAAVATPCALSIEGLRKVYARGSEALCGIDLDVPTGDFFALLGPNGAGKSTTIGIVTSLVTKTAGRVEVFGHDLDRDPEAAKAQIGLVPQEFNFNQFEPVVEIVVNQAGYYGIPRRAAYARAREVLGQLDLWERRDTEARRLSGGMKRRLMIARALVHRPRLLILDEPTAGVDIEIRRSMWQFLREINAAGTTIILTTHYLEEAESLCRHIAIINHGHIVERATMRELLRRLQTELFVLNVAGDLKNLPAVEGYRLDQVDDDTLEVAVPREVGLNRLFEALGAAGIEVQSLRNKQNRLEQLFLGLLEQRGRTAP
jgi:ABC-2 type transport system ATP-binding protein